MVNPINAIHLLGEYLKSYWILPLLVFCICICYLMMYVICIAIYLHLLQKEINSEYSVEYDMNTGSHTLSIQTPLLQSKHSQAATYFYQASCLDNSSMQNAAPQQQIYPIEPESAQIVHFVTRMQQNGEEMGPIISKLKEQGVECKIAQEFSKEKGDVNIFCHRVSGRIPWNEKIETELQNLIEQSQHNQTKIIIIFYAINTKGMVHNSDQHQSIYLKLCKGLQVLSFSLQQKKKYLQNGKDSISYFELYNDDKMNHLQFDKLIKLLK